MALLMGWTVNKRKTTLSHLFLPKEYSGDPYTSVFTHHTEAEVLSFLETGWEIGNVGGQSG